MEAKIIPGREKDFRWREGKKPKKPRWRLLGTSFTAHGHWRYINRCGGFVHQNGGARDNGLQLSLGRKIPHSLNALVAADLCVRKEHLNNNQSVKRQEKRR